MTAPQAAIVREFRHMLLWPLQLRRMAAGSGFKHPWDALAANPGPWQLVKDNLLIDDESCHLGYREFVYFLPYVQRFLYGFGEADAKTRSSLHIFKREDITHARVTLHEGSDPVDFDVSRLRLIFFYDVDIAVLAMEISAHDLPLAQAVETMDRFGRPYPPSWDGPTQAAHCIYKVELMDGSGHSMVVSDYGERDKYISRVRDIKQTPLSLHWEKILKPLVPAYLGGGMLQYYQIENKRIPIMSFLSFDEPRALSKGDLSRIGFAAKWGPSDTLPFSPRFLADFEEKYCYDRFYDPDNPASAMDTRITLCGPAFAMITKHGPTTRDLVQTFRHQFFQIGVIVNFHKGALLNLSNRFSVAVERLRVGDYDSVRIFKQSARETLEMFLRFNHRYWFHEISNQVYAADVYRRWSHQLGSEQLCAEVRDEARDINEYLDADRTRRSADNAQRLTVVSACGMVGTVATGFLGMNLFAHSELGTWEKIIIFVIVFIPTIALTAYTVMISRRLATFFEALASERMTWGEKVGALRQSWGSGKRVRMKRVAGGDAPTRRTQRPHPEPAETVPSSD
ncbi:MAG TPA: CorA family divalent cation transporter [Usitatibacter sp.]|nr:CorA family divalent cation transporter [Usitatibacter sp.]